MTGTQLYLRLLSHVRPYWRIYALAILGMLLSATTEVALPAAAKPFLDVQAAELTCLVRSSRATEPGVARWR